MLESKKLKPYKGIWARQRICGIRRGQTFAANIFKMPRHIQNPVHEYQSWLNPNHLDHVEGGNKYPVIWRPTQSLLFNTHPDYIILRCLVQYWDWPDWFYTRRTADVVSHIIPLIPWASAQLQLVDFGTIRPQTCMMQSSLAKYGRRLNCHKVGQKRLAKKIY